jgi:hypothetical protein
MLGEYPEDNLLLLQHGESLKTRKDILPFDIHVTVHRDKFHIIKPTRFTNYSNLFLE